MNFRYDSSGRVSYSVPTYKIKYDDVVDRSNFRQDAHNIRDLINNGADGNRGVYDDPDNLPDNLTVKLRSGKFDKAEVSQMILKQTELVEKSKDNDKKENEQKKLEQINQARQEYLDKKTGFVGQQEE